MADTVEHRWDLAPREAIRLQRELAGRIVQRPVAGPVRTVAGVDCAFLDQGRRIVAAVVVMDVRTLEEIESVHATAEVPMPYIPGLLSFREAPTELEAIARLSRPPDLLLVDGAGLAHPRRLGIASHLGLWLTIPTVGVAKSRLCGAHRPVGGRRGCCVQLKDKNEVIGGVLRTRDRVKPVYVSVGDRITLREALRWTLRTTRGYRLPEPIRAADRMAGRLKAVL